MVFLLDHLWCVFIFLFLIAQKKRGMPPTDHQNFQRLPENILWELKFSMPNTLHQKKDAPQQDIFSELLNEQWSLVLKIMLLTRPYFFLVAVRIPPNLMKTFSGSDTPPSPENPGGTMKNVVCLRSQYSSSFFYSAVAERAGRGRSASLFWER